MSWTWAGIIDVFDNLVQLGRNWYSVYEPLLRELSWAKVYEADGWIPFSLLMFITWGSQIEESKCNAH